MEGEIKMRTIELGHGYRVKAVDALNWELEHWHEPTKGGDRRPKWNRLGKYHATLGGAMAAVLERVAREGEGDEALSEAVERVESAAAAMVEAVDASLRPSDMDGKRGVGK